MKSKLPYIKLVLVAGLVFGLYSFAGNRSNGRDLKDVALNFTNTENLYVTEEAVNKLLIQNKIEPRGLKKEALDLNRVEGLLNTHAMIENAEVFLSIDGVLQAAITQRQPIGRVLGNQSYYIDRQGAKMPLSPFHSARVPLVSGISEEDHKEIYPLLSFIAQDDFLSRQIIEIRRSPGGIYQFNIRESDFSVVLGEVKDLERKFKNYKAFYQEALKDKKLNSYKKVNLRFGNQVVCTKI